MRCVLRPITWSPLPIVLMLAVLPTDTFAQAPVCQTIRRGESATQAARRVTGNSRNVYQPSFQIMNASSRFVPKSQYNRIRAGWRACVIKPAVQLVASNANRREVPDAADAFEAPAPSAVPERVAEPMALVVATAGSGGTDADAAVATPQPEGADVRRRTWFDLRMLWLGAAMVVPWVGWRIADDYLARRRTAAIVVQHFADRFIDEFERPLIRYRVEDHPVKSRVRRGSRRGRFDILLAPAEGRRYPNLSDHKKNVEYDVARVMHVLADESFVCREPYMQAGWIVVPFQFTAGPKQGVSCISSF